LGRLEVEATAGAIIGNTYYYGAGGFHSIIKPSPSTLKFIYLLFRKSGLLGQEY
jgi:hypothetical protein